MKRNFRLESRRKLMTKEVIQKVEKIFNEIDDEESNGEDYQDNDYSWSGGFADNH